MQRTVIFSTEMLTVAAVDYQGTPGRLNSNGKSNPTFPMKLNRQLRLTVLKNK